MRWTLATILLLFVAGYIAIQSHGFQTWAARQAAAWLSNELKTEVQIDALRINFWTHFEAENLLIRDLQNDTLIFCPLVSLSDFHYSESKKRFRAGSIMMQKPFVNLHKNASDSLLNLHVLTDYFSSNDTSKTKTPAVYITRFNLVDGRFNYINDLRAYRESGLFDWNHIQLSNLSLEAENFRFKDDSLFTNLCKLKAHDDYSGFYLQDFQADLAIGNQKCNFDRALIRTNQSVIAGNLSFGLKSVDDLENFISAVPMNCSFDQSYLELADLGFFSSYMQGIKRRVVFSGRVKGKIESLKGKDFYLQLDDHTKYEGNFSFDGLPEIEQTYMSFDVRSLTSNKTELDRIPIPPFKDHGTLTTPSNFAELGQMEFKGNFTGFMNDFVAYGSLKTALGIVKSDISLREDSIKNDFVYKGAIATEAFDLGVFYRTPSLGKLSSDLKLDGSGLTLDALDATFEGTISEVGLNGYNYQNIKADGDFKKKFFDGNISIRDPNLLADFVGQINFRDKKPELHFATDLKHLDLKATKLLTQYPYSSVSAEIEMNSHGLTLNDFEGVIKLKDLTWCTASDEYFIDHIDLETTRSNGLDIRLNSEVATGYLKGQFDLAEIPASINQVLSKIIPHYNPPFEEHKVQDFELSLDVKDFADVSGIFAPELCVSPHSTLDLYINEAKSFFELTLASEEIDYGDFRVHGLVLDASHPDSSLFLNLITDRFYSGNFYFDKLSVDARADKDTVFTDIAWGDTTSAHGANINGKLMVRNYNAFDFIFGNSQVNVKGTQWQIDYKSKISLDTTSIAIGHLGLRSGVQYITAFGKISEDKEDQMNIAINDFDLKNLEPFIGRDPQLLGIVRGEAAVRDVYHDFIFSSDLNIDGFSLNDYLIGNIGLKSIYENELKRINLSGDIEKGNFVPLQFSGYYYTSREENSLDILANLVGLDIAFINEFIGEDVLKLEGNLNGQILIGGTPSNPEMRGKAYFNQASVFIPYLNTTYFVEDHVGIEPDMFTFDRIPIKDQENNQGFLTATIIHEVFSKWNFDVVVDMDKPFLAMNTNEDINTLYYGKAFTTGYVNLSGTEEQIDFDINLRSEKGTSLAMPMNATSDIAFENFIHFVGKNNKDAPKLDLSGIKLNMEFDITPDAEFQIIFDKAVGDVMSGTGRGHLNMEINNLSTFNMYGSIEVVQGKYLFTLKNLLNKEFSVKPGGTISWFGDPFAADLNLEAIYKVSASLSEILPDVNKNGQRVPVDLVMQLTGKMFNPGVDFDINLPTVDQVTKSRVESVISTDQERNRQAFSLLVLRRFVSPPNISGASNSSQISPLLDNSSELLSSQISNWLSQISSDFNLGFKYRPGDEISNQEIALALSTQLFNDRMSIAGNVGVSKGNATNANPTNYIGDLRIEYKITDDGKIKLVVYNESNDYRIATTQQSLYTQGVGVLYQEEFDTMDEFYCAFKNLFRRKRSRIICDGASNS